MDNQDHFGFKIGRDRSTITGLNILRFGAEERKNLLQSPIDTPNGVEEVHLPQKYQQQKVPTIVINDHNEIAEHSCQLVSKSHWEYKKVNGVEKIEIGMANNNLSRSDSRQRNKPVRDNNFNLENKSHEVVLNSLSDVDTTRSEEDLVKTAQTQERLSLDRVSVVTKKDYRKYSLPSDLSWDSKQVRDMNKPLGAEQLSEPDVLFKHRQSVFGDMGLDDSYSPGDRCATDSGFKEQLFSFFQATDNKLALKLYGSKSAVQKEKRRQQQAHACIIHPCSNFRLYWDLLMLIFLVTNLIVLPVAIAFFFDDVGSHWLFFNITCDVLFALDILFNFRTGLIDHESHGEVILDGKIIARRYLKGWFTIDFLSSLPLDYIFLVLEGELYAAGRAIKILRLTKILQLLRLLRISRLVRYIQIWQEYFSIASIVVRIFNLICVMVLLSHWSGCIQFAVPVFQGWPEDSWIALENLQNAHWWTCYTKSLLKALSHMLSTGYGQYPPKNVTDTWLTIASMVAGCACYALFVGHTTALIQSFDTSSRQFRDHLQQVHEYMSFRKLPADLRQRVVNYYDHRYGGKMFNEQVILAELSDTLRKDIINHNCKELIQKVPFFINADSNFINEVITKLEFEMFQSGDIILQMHTKGQKMYFIQEGVVEVLDESNKVVTRLADGSYFGEISLLTQQNRTATVRASTYVNLFSLKQDDFDHILIMYPLMKRTLETIAAQRLTHLGRDPAILTSRESLLDDVSGFQTIIQENTDFHSDEEDLLHSKKPTENNNILNAFKGFFTQDSDNFEHKKSKFRSSTPSPAKTSNDDSKVNRCKSNLQFLIAPIVLPMSRKVHSSNDINSSSHMINSQAANEKQLEACYTTFSSAQNITGSEDVLYSKAKKQVTYKSGLED